MAHELGRLRVGHRVDLLEALGDVAVARLLVGEVHRRVAVHARARLLHDHLALREPLVLEHVGVAALFAEIFGEGVALPDGLEALVLLDLGARDDRARVGLGRRVRHGLAAAVLGALHVDRLLVELVVLRERLAPFGRVVDVVVEGRARVLLRVGLRDAGCGNEQEDGRERGQDHASDSSKQMGCLADHAVCSSKPAMHPRHSIPDRGIWGNSGTGAMTAVCSVDVVVLLTGEAP